MRNALTMAEHLLEATLVVVEPLSSCARQHAASSRIVRQLLKASCSKLFATEHGQAALG